MDEQECLDFCYLYSAKDGDLASVRGYLSKGANPKAVDQYGNTALMLAVHGVRDEKKRAGAMEVLQALLPVCDPDALGHGGQSFLGIAAGDIYPDALKLALAHCDLSDLGAMDMIPMLHAAQEGRVANLALLLPWFDPRKVDSFGRSPLSMAIASGSQECVEILLPLSDLSWSRPTDGGGLMALAQRSDRLLEIVVRAGAPFTQDDRGLSPIHQAVIDGVPGRLEILAISPGFMPALALRDERGDLALCHAKSGSDEEFFLKRWHAMAKERVQLESLGRVSTAAPPKPKRV